MPCDQRKMGTLPAISKVNYKPHAGAFFCFGSQLESPQFDIEGAMTRRRP